MISTKISILPLIGSKLAACRDGKSPKPVYQHSQLHCKQGPGGPSHHIVPTKNKYGIKYEKPQQW